MSQGVIFMGYDIDRLRSDLINFYGCKSPIPIYKIIIVDLSSEEELIKIAIKNNFDLERYKIKIKTLQEDIMDIKRYILNTIIFFTVYSAVYYLLTKNLNFDVIIVSTIFYMVIYPICEKAVKK